MASAVFDSHAFVKGAVAAGMVDRQAEFLASSYQNLLTDRIATKDDITRLELRMDRLEGMIWRVSAFQIAVMIALFGAFAAFLQ